MFINIVPFSRYLKEIGLGANLIAPFRDQISKKLWLHISTRFENLLLNIAFQNLFAFLGIDDNFI